MRRPLRAARWRSIRVDARGSGFGKAGASRPSLVLAESSAQKLHEVRWRTSGTDWKRKRPVLIKLALIKIVIPANAGTQLTVLELVDWQWKLKWPESAFKCGACAVIAHEQRMCRSTSYNVRSDIASTQGWVPAFAGMTTLFSFGPLVLSAARSCQVDRAGTNPKWPTAPAGNAASPRTTGSPPTRNPSPDRPPIAARR